MAYTTNIYSTTLEAAEDLTEKQYFAVKVDNTGKAELCDTAGERVFGVIQNKPNTGEAVSVMLLGISKIEVGTGGVTAGSLWQTDASGKAINATSGDYSLGTVLETRNDGEIATVTVGTGFSAQIN